MPRAGPMVEERRRRGSVPFYIGHASGSLTSSARTTHRCCCRGGAETGAPRGLATAPPPATNDDDDDDDDDDLLNAPLARERLTITSPSPWRSPQMLSRSRLWLECATAKKHSRVGGRSPPRRIARATVRPERFDFFLVTHPDRTSDHTRIKDRRTRRTALVYHVSCWIVHLVHLREV